MQIHSLTLNDFSSCDYHLIGIHCALEDFRLAYLMNLHLQLNFKRSAFDIDFKNTQDNACHSLYEFMDRITENSWYLISNNYKAKDQINKLSLFKESQKVTYLIPEKKKVDYFLKLEGDFNLNIIDKKIKKIPQITTSYIIEISKLKSKESLIF